MFNYFLEYIDTEHAKDIINTSPLFGSYNTGTLTINIHMPTLTRRYDLFDIRS
jgi:hypothetical protein